MNYYCISDETERLWGQIEEEAEVILQSRQVFLLEEQLHRWMCLSTAPPY